MQAEIITIGDEILIGQIIDSNSAWIAQRLNEIGINVHQITSVSDSRPHILASLSEAEARADLVLMTGGLGPTADDITKPTLAAYFGAKLVMDEPTLAHIRERIFARGRKLNERNVKQAEVPDNCEIIPNTIGTAPIMWFERNNTVFISMPGVPFEMKTVMQTGVLPRIKQHFKTQPIIHKTVMTQGVPESEMAEKLSGWEGSLPPHIKLAYLPSPESLRLRLSATGKPQAVLEKEIQFEIDKLQPLIGRYIFGYDNRYLHEIVGDLLKSSNATMASAESCTGGRIAHLITQIPGSSAYYKGSVVAYSNEIKQNVLSVSTKSLVEHGAVSKEVVEQMAINVCKLMKTDYGVATSGIAGPGGATDDKPVGTTWIAAADKHGNVRSKTYQINISREVNIRLATSNALQILRFMIEGIE